jgi:hypothetical protein
LVAKCSAAERKANDGPRSQEFEATCYQSKVLYFWHLPVARLTFKFCFYVILALPLRKNTLRLRLSLETEHGVFGS